MRGYARPEMFVSDAADTFERLEHGYESDMSRAQAVQPEWASEQAALYILPEAAWARRVSGVYSNSLANAAPDRAHAVLTIKRDGDFLVSVRAPLHDKRDADTLCRQFATGGGRSAAAGINALPETDLPRFIEALSATYR